MLGPHLQTPPHCEFWAFRTDMHSIAECYSNGGGTDNFGTLVLPRLPDEEATDNSGSRKGKEGVSSALVMSLRS